MNESTIGHSDDPYSRDKFYICPTCVHSTEAHEVAGCRVCDCEHAYPCDGCFVCR